METFMYGLLFLAWLCAWKGLTVWMNQSADWVDRKLREHDARAQDK